MASSCIWSSDERPCILRVVDVKTVCRADNGTHCDFCHFCLQQNLVAHVNSKRMGGWHHLAEVGKVFHLVVAADGIVH